MLYFTSFGFGIVSFMFKRRTWLRPALVILMGTSILHHSKSHEVYRGKQVVATADKALAHAVTIGAVVRGLQHHITAPIATVYTATLGYVFYAYHLARLCHKPQPHGAFYHSTLHIAAFVGLAACAMST